MGTGVLVKTCLLGALALVCIGAAQADENPCEPSDISPIDYQQALCMSFFFYEAQRSGKLPENNRVSWRGDSALDDGSDVGHDLTGGYYDAGDLVKYGFPMSFTITMLAWGLIDFSDGYSKAGQTDYALEAIKWGTDYFIKCYTSTNEFWGQVGTGAIDHALWNRPENMTEERPSFKIDAENPGSELAAETAAALAASYILYKDTDADSADQMLAVAQELYEFADNFRGIYDDVITDAADSYHSWSGYGDELVWAGLWLYRATENETYLTRAKGHWDEFNFQYSAAFQFSWDDKTAGVYALFWLLEGSQTYLDHLNTYLDYLQNTAPYTPEGLVFLSSWGSNRHAANVAFLALWAAKQGVDTAQNSQWGQEQMDQLLGANSRYNMTFVVGFGDKYPERPHHRASSCPDPPEACNFGWAYTQPGPNPHVLYGGLVGGPDENGDYEDDRSNYEQNEVACDYNAAYSGALAALVELS
ncbi:endoglucanase E-4 [Cherax quadricarinatus]